MLNNPLGLVDPSGHQPAGAIGSPKEATPIYADPVEIVGSVTPDYPPSNIHEWSPYPKYTLTLNQYPDPTTLEKDWAAIKASDLGRSLYAVWTMFSTSQEIALPFAVAAAAAPALGAEAAGGVALEELAAIERASVYLAENSPRELAIRRLAAQGIKHTAGAIETIGVREGVTVFLEQGTARKGLQHLLSRPERVQDFAKVGVAPGEIPEVVMKAVTQGEYLGARKDGLIFAVRHGGQMLRLEVVVADNGFIVTAIPRGLLP